ncbi:hypothetical protein FB45DRAFT_1006162 [Roridomyces roridus]|uniref:Uncharacterized protein n=1 Tax=Roridomyces roridus TaxID=1738132 RepID=A0AAD7BIK2_9AGAR|nr:hypothetical protein FB45DRAFT_1006162 [Roridomyces roridus]
MHKLTVASILIGFLASFTTAAPTPAKVLVPGAGFRLASTVHQVPDGGSLAHIDESTIHVLDAAGAVVKAVTHTPTKVKSAVEPLETGWVAYASWLNTGSSPISSFKTTFTVPPVPAANHGQTVFLFNSIEPNSGDAILQPVLQFGPSAAGGGSFWAVASWYLVGDSTFFTNPIRTSAGATLDGVITLTSSSGSSFNYVTSFSNIAGTSLTATGSAQLTWATETLEAYGVTTKADYPAGSTVFSAIDLVLSNGNAPSVSWSTVSDSPDGISTKVNTSGATNAEITITY